MGRIDYIKIVPSMPGDEQPQAMVKVTGNFHYEDAVGIARALEKEGLYPGGNPTLNYGGVTFVVTGKKFGYAVATLLNLMGF